MEGAELDVSELEITDDKVAYIVTKGVTSPDVYEVFYNAPHFGVGPGNRAPRYNMIGPTLTGRMLLAAIAPTPVEGRWRVITAYWLGGSRGQRDYERLAP